MVVVTQDIDQDRGDREWEDRGDREGPQGHQGAQGPHGLPGPGLAKNSGNTYAPFSHSMMRLN